MQGHQQLSHCSCAEIIRLAIICPTYPPAMQLCKWKKLQVQITDAQPLDLLRIIPKLPSISGLRKPMKYDKLPRIICNQNTLDDVIIYCTCMFTDLYFRNQPNILTDIYIFSAQTSICSVTYPIISIYDIYIYIIHILYIKYYTSYIIYKMFQ